MLPFDQEHEYIALPWSLVTIPLLRQLSSEIAHTIIFLSSPTLHK
jgi:hypothetical protein